MSHDTETGTYPEWIPNSPTINADNGSSVSSSFNVTVGEKLKSWLMAVAFVCSTAGFFAFGILYMQVSNQLMQKSSENAEEVAKALRKDAIAQDLNGYDFRFFMQNDLVRLKTDIEVTKQLASKCK